MKNLSYFLWLCVMVLAGYVAYFFLTTTKWREQDLAMVERQNEALQKVATYGDYFSSQYFYKLAELVEKSGGTNSKDSSLLDKALTIRQFGNSSLFQVQKDVETENWEGLYNNYVNISQSISLVDTSLKELREIPTKTLIKDLENTSIKTHYWLHIKNQIVQKQSCGIERIIARYCLHDMWVSRSSTMVIANQKIVNEGNSYEAQILFHNYYTNKKINSVGCYQCKNSIIFEGERVTFSYKPIDFGNQEFSKQKITLAAKVYLNYKKDTTYYLPITYTVKRKK